MLNLISLFSSSSGNCTYVFNDDTKLLVDIGISAKRLTEALKNMNILPEEINGVLITHEHSDHIKGIRVFCKKHNIPVYASKKTWQALVSLEIPQSLKNNFEPLETFYIGSIKILPFPIPHDAIDPCGFNLVYNDEKVTVATDVGHITPQLLSSFENSKTILLESNHDVDMLRAGSYPYLLKQRIIGNYGHLSNVTSAETVEYLIKKGTKNFILAHLSESNNMPSLALETVKSRLYTNHVDLTGISIEVAKP